ncbi:MAG: hypothetical protein RLZZ303_1677 [Candidatus Hydrogenedentota bacterium]
MDSGPLSRVWQGSHKLVRELGRGGMGVVWEAWDERLERRVAVKMLHPYLFTDAHVAERLLKEARIAARIEHPNVVRVYRVDMVDDRLAIEMQYIEGGALPDVLTMAALPGSQAADLLGQILAALTACHAQEVIHCDLKPGNLLVSVEGNVYLSDFGIARALTAIEQTNPGTPVTSAPLWGTPQYSPPEAWQGGDPSPLWDLYSAGVIVYESLVGEPPFEGRTPLAVMLEKYAKPLPPIESRRNDLSPEFAALIDSLCSQDPSKRPESAHAAMELLRATPEHRNRDSRTEPIRVAPRPQPTVPTPASGYRTHLKSLGKRWPWFVLAVGLIMAGAFLARQTLAPGLLGGRGMSPAMTPVSAELGQALSLHVQLQRAFFSYDDGVHGRELWCANPDGEPWMVGDLYPGPIGSDPGGFLIRSSTESVFHASTPEHGDELWRIVASDAVVNPALIRDIFPGPMGSEPRAMLADGILAIFYATTLEHGREIWATNGRAPQTAIVADLIQGSSGSNPMQPHYHLMGRHAYLIAFTEAANGMALIRYSFEKNELETLFKVDAHHLGSLDGKLYLNHFEGEYGRELWRYDPETGEFSLFADIQPGAGSCSPAEFFAWKNRLYFQATTEAHGQELWSTDGTPEGTKILFHGQPGSTGSNPFGFVDAGDTFFFKATSELYGTELYRSEGSGAHLVSDLMPGTRSAMPYNMVYHDNTLFFSADDGQSGEELWSLDTRQPDSKPALVADINPGPAHSGAHHLQFDEQGTGYFTATSEDGLRHVYRLRRVGESWTATRLRLPVPKGWEQPQ